MEQFCIVDFETTGGSPRQGDAIIQIGAVTIDHGQITNRYATFVKPEQPIPAFITSLTGITDEMVADAPTLDEALPGLLRLLKGRVFVAHNASFDLQFLQEALLSQGYYTFDGNVIDTVELARMLLPIQGSYRLTELADDLEISHDNPHQADSDAQATAQLFLHLLQILDDLPLVVIQRLQMLVHTFRSDITALLRYVEMEKLADLSDEQAPDPKWDIYRQFALKKRFPLTSSPASGAVGMTHNLEEVLAGSLGDYQQRDAQQEMIQSIQSAMEDGVHLLVEAGTGTGKSLAYLLPSIVWAKQNQEKVLVSTHTITLQEQLFQKEIPALQKALPFSFTAAQMKGRGNYLCLRKFEQNINEGAQEYSHEIQLAKAQMVTWLTQTESGDVEELHLPPSGQLFWQQVKSDTNSCLNRKCPWFSRCYYFQAKERAREAEIVIVNHALLVSDLETESGILPSYQVGIIDEAHQLEDAATQHMGFHYSTVQMLFLLDRLGAEAPERLLSQLLTEFAQWKEEERSLTVELGRRFDRLQVDLREAVTEWSQHAYNYAAKQAKEMNEIGRISVRYKKGKFQGKQAKILPAAEKVIALTLDYAKLIEETAVQMIQGEEQVPFAVKSLLTDARGLSDDLKKAAELIHALFLADDKDFVYWMELESRTSRKYVYFTAAPLDVSVPLSEKLFAGKRSMTLTSATLTVKNSFDYMKERYGLQQLPKERVRTLSLPSPFDYEHQGLVLIPSDFPPFNKETESLYLDAVIQGSVDVIRASQGRTMILFTSYTMLRQVYDGLKQLLDENQFTLLGHGIDSSNRSKLIKKFKQSERAVLLGTSSFWEGVDIAGDALSSLIIVRLPFVPPNHPILEARSEMLKDAGKNAFMSLHLPHAVIRFKQGVGRLIRHHRDRGVIVLFDPRVIEARYGRAFLQSLPPFQKESGPWIQLRERIEPFLAGES
ncbi:ATP-dependent helicase DinG [Brevibacillus fluminis]|uniref:3'-5' exonuclease DinG n=1 Tax=Brevibacillus fluminis TaxID=511487 RepID=A0A3M8D1B8_9BACL|nr:ATP-dependent DNA helicase DinG [Brevibacillus fluminis]RNB81668.1 ATP-dependent helicase DinG [Brevibacillus fluminis]